MEKKLIKHICIFTQTHLANNPRVVKEANVYAEAGYKVTVYAVWYDSKLLKIDRTLIHPEAEYKAGVDLLKWKSLESRVIRSRRRIGRELMKHLKIETVSSLGYGFKYYLHILQKENADLYIGHTEMSMALAKALIEGGKKVAFDFEDWHSKDLLIKDRAYRPIRLLEQLESYLLKNSFFCYTTSGVMAEAMSKYYNLPRPNIIYNSFLAADRKNIDGRAQDVIHNTTPSLYWFSQVIGPGRGLELILKALQFTTIPFQFHIRGRITEEYKDYLIKAMPGHIELYVHDVVPPSELLSRTSEHSIGLAIEEITPESRNFTITNKFFHYLQAGIPVLATKTAGQLEIAKIIPEAICPVERDPRIIGQTLDVLLNSKERLYAMKQASWRAGENYFSYEQDSCRLLTFLHQ